MFLFLVSLAFGLDMIEQEIEHTLALANVLQSKIDYLSVFRQELMRDKIEIPDEENWKKMPGLLPQPDHDSFPLRVNLISSISESVKSLDFIALKSKDSTPHIGFVLCQNSLVSLYEVTGELIGTYAVSGILFCAGSSTPEEPLIAIVSNFEIIILALDGNNIQFLSSHKVLNDTALPTTLIQYSRIGKKYWLVGDDWGRVTFYSAYGEFISQGSSGTSKITTLDKFGSQIVYAGDHKVGILNLATMEPYLECEPTIGKIIDVAQDFSATIIYVSTDNGDIIIYDTKFVSSTSAPYCKAMAKFPNERKHNKLAVIRNSLLAVSENTITSYNVSGLEQDVFYSPTYYQINENFEKVGVKSLRLPGSGNFLMLYGTGKVLIFDVKNIGFMSAPGDWIDFGGVRILAVVFTIGGVFLYRSLNKKTKNTEAEVKGNQRGGGNKSGKRVNFSNNPQMFRYEED